MDIDKIQARLREFARERDWEQFHSPKNISMALCVEAAELLEHFQWLSEEKSASFDSLNIEEIAAEIADIQIYLAMIADKLNIDIAQSVEKKIDRNAVKYPTGA